MYAVAYAGCIQGVSVYRVLVQVYGGVCRVLMSAACMQDGSVCRVFVYVVVYAGCLQGVSVCRVLVYSEVCRVLVYGGLCRVLVYARCMQGAPWVFRTS